VIGSSTATGKTSLLQLLEKMKELMLSESNINTTMTVETPMDDLAEYPPNGPNVTGDLDFYINGDLKWCFELLRMAIRSESSSDVSIRMMANTASST
jgi:hypothetical protein